MGQIILDVLFLLAFWGVYSLLDKFVLPGQSLINTCLALGIVFAFVRLRVYFDSDSSE